MPECNVCGVLLESVFYKSGNDCSITSLGEICPQETVIFQCCHCLHIQTDPLKNLDEYYDKSYKILIESEEEDQLYMDQSGNKSLRIDHEIRVLLSKVKIKSNARVLDYGCGKALSLKKLKKLLPTIDPYVFDVSEDYKFFWKDFVPNKNQGTYSLKEEWQNTFDIVLSFFSLEHVNSPNDFVQKIHLLLRDGGIFYGVVPNMYQNTGDFLVIDHVNHFCENSLKKLLLDNGFSDVDVDSVSHYGAYVFSAKKSAELSEERYASLAATIDFNQEAIRIRNFWAQMSKKISEYEAQTFNSRKVIYGSGFYGTLIAANLKHMEKVTCFVDQNPYRQGKVLFGKPIIGLDDFPSGIESILVGLSPSVARQVVEELKDSLPGGIEYFILE